jgi:predicted urease superfamily metal-dependent hydrolase
MNSQMLLGRFDSMANLIGIKSMKVIQHIQNLILREFQDLERFQSLIMMKNLELIDDQRNQEGSRVSSQIIH